MALLDFRGAGWVARLSDPPPEGYEPCNCRQKLPSKNFKVIFVASGPGRSTCLLGHQARRGPQALPRGTRKLQARPRQLQDHPHAPPDLPRTAPRPPQTTPGPPQTSLGPPEHLPKTAPGILVSTGRCEGSCTFARSSCRPGPKLGWPDPMTALGPPRAAPRPPPGPPRTAPRPP